MTRHIVLYREKDGCSFCDKYKFCDKAITNYATNKIYNQHSVINVS